MKTFPYKRALTTPSEDKRTRVWRWLLSVGSVLALAFWTVLTWRILAVIFFAAFFLAVVSYSSHRSQVFVVSALLLCLTGLLLPVDIRLADGPITRRVVPYCITGMPTPEELEAAEAGEIYLVGTCVPSPSYPKWIILFSLNPYLQSPESP